MKFEEKLGEQYNKIANHVSDMIPGPWEKVNLVAYMKESSSEVFFFYNIPNNEKLFYALEIPEDFDVSEREFMKRLMELNRMFRKLRNKFIENQQEPFGTCEFDFTIESKLKVSFEYIDWEASEFGPSEKFDYYRYKKFGILPKFQYEIDDLHAVEKYVKESQEK